VIRTLSHIRRPAKNRPESDGPRAPLALRPFLVGRGAGGGDVDVRRFGDMGHGKPETCTFRRQSLL
jgi:hypothetical protein